MNFKITIGKSIVVILAFFVSQLSYIFAQQPLFWKSYSTLPLPCDRGIALKTTPDTGAITCGISKDAMGTLISTLTKFDKNGTPVWNKLYHNSDANTSCDIEFTPNGYLLGGSFSTSSLVPCNPMLFETDAIGNVLWAKEYNFSIPMIHAVTNVLKLSSGDIIFISTSDMSIPPVYSFITRTDNLGNVIWSKRIYPFSSNAVVGFQLKEIPGGAILVSGSYFSPNYATGNISFLAKLDGQGNSIWAKEYILSNYTSYTSEASDGIYLTSSGDIIIPSMILSFGSAVPQDPPFGREGPYMLKLDSNGNVKFCKDYGLQFSGYPGTKYLKGSNSLTFILGRIDTVANNYNQGVFFTVDSIGRVLVSKAYNNTAWTNLSWCGAGLGGSAMDSTVFGGYLAYGYKEFSPANQYETSLISFDGLGNAGGCYEAPLCINPRCVPVQTNPVSGFPNHPVIASAVTLTATSGITQSSICSGTSTLSPTAKNQALASVYTSIKKGLIQQDTITLSNCSTVLTASYPACWVDNLTWSTGAVNQTTIAVNSPGIYWVGVKDCSSSAYAMVDTVVVLPAPPTISIQPAQVLSCSNPSTTLVASPLSPGLTFTWLPGSSGASSLVVNTPGTYTLICNGPSLLCPSYATVTVLQNTGPSFSVTLNPPALLTCSNYSTILSVAFPSPVYSHTWLPGNAHTSTLSVHSAGIYTLLTSNITSSAACIVTNTLQVKQINTFNISVTKKDVCYGGGGSFATLNAGSGIGPFTYEWAGNQTGPTASPLLAGDHTYTVTDVGSGCKKTGTVTIQQLAAINITVTATKKQVCSGDPLGLLAAADPSPALSYYWSNGSSTPSIAVNTNSSSVLSLTVTDLNNCKATTHYSIPVDPLPELKLLSSPANGCEPLCVTFSASTSADQVNWDFGDKGFSVLSQLTKCFTAGTYPVMLSVKDKKGCKNNAFDLIRVYPKPVASFVAEPNPASILEPRISFNNTSLNTSFCAWNFGESADMIYKENTTYTYDKPGNYLSSLVVKNVYGCSDTAFTTVKIEEDFAVYIPDTFSPNEDNKNDTWGPYGVGISDKHYQLRIFNRWGETLFHTNSPKEQWNGCYKGEPVKEDVYIYSLNLRSANDGQPRHLNGHVTLIR